MSLLRGLLALASLAVLLFAGAAASPATAPGVRLDAETPDTTPWLLPQSGAEACFVDADGIGSYSAGEPLLLKASGGCGGSPIGAVRMAAFDDAPAGAVIGARDTEAQSTTRAFTTPARFKYVDRDGDGRASPGDSLYLDALNANSHLVEAGDVRVTSWGALPGGAYVAVGDADLGARLSLVASGTHLGYADVNGDGSFQAGDRLYMRAKAETAPAVLRLGDLRLGGADAAEYGRWVTLGEPDAPARLVALADAKVCRTGGTAYRAGDTVIVRSGSCAGAAMPGDLRLGGAAGNGLAIEPGDPDEGQPLRAASATLSYRDAGGASGFDAGDSLYLDLAGSSRVVDAGDLRLTPREGLAAPAPVREGDPDLGDALAELGAPGEVLGFADANQDGAFEGRDALYANRDRGGSEDVEVGDVRLFARGGEFFLGSQATTGSADVVRRLTAKTFAVCLADEDNDNQHDRGEMAYLNPDSCSGGVKAGALRLLPLGSHAAGSRVALGGEVGLGLVAVTSEVRYLDADGSATWTAGDSLYLHFATGSSGGKAQPGDVRLTAYGERPAGSEVGGEDGDRSMGLVLVAASLSSLTAYADADGDGAYGTADALYLRVVSPVAGSATFGHVRLSALEAPPGAPAAGEEPPADQPEDDDLRGIEDELRELREQLRDSDGDGYTDVVERQRGSDSEDPSSRPGQARAKDSPSAGAWLMVLALGAAAIWARRRR